MLGIDAPTAESPAGAPCDDDIVDRFEDQLARKRHLRCVFPTPTSVAELLPVVKVRSAAADSLYAHVAAGATTAAAVAVAAGADE